MDAFFKRIWKNGFNKAGLAMSRQDVDMDINEVIYRMAHESDPVAMVDLEREKRGLERQRGMINQLISTQSW
jgi:hypothetical protein